MNALSRHLPVETALFAVLGTRYPLHPLPTLASNSLNAMVTPVSKTYRNAMEPLVVQEVQRQMQQLAPSALRHVNADDVIAYALNSLPALYATTETGWLWQQSRAQKDLAGQVSAAVCQGLMVVHQTPERSEDRLCSPESSLFAAQKALQELSIYLGCPNLTWLNLLPAIKSTLAQVARRTA
ncbi:MAG: late competence development ComFB family protein [Synechococcales cyanobacterium CRU_2_2]|nr:late competence development ComFB family protein [Synechococcales cyanobacterium CRU_2_2]